MYVCSHWPIEGASNSVCASRDPSWFAVFAQPQQDAPRCQGLVYAVLVHSRSIPVLLGKLRYKVICYGYRYSVNRVTLSSC